MCYHHLPWYSPCSLWFYLLEYLSSSALSSSCIPVRFFRRYSGGSAMCLRCESSTRHEYLALSSFTASANDGMRHGTLPPGICAIVDTSAGFVTGFAAPSSCVQFAMPYTWGGARGALARLFACEMCGVTRDRWRRGGELYIVK